MINHTSTTGEQCAYIPYNLNILPKGYVLLVLNLAYSVQPVAALYLLGSNLLQAKS